MNNTKNNFIKNLKELAAGLDLVGKQQEMFVEKAAEELIKKFDFVFDDELEAPCSECGAKQKGSWSVYCPFCGKDGTDSNK